MKNIDMAHWASLQAIDVHRDYNRLGLTGKVVYRTQGNCLKEHALATLENYGSVTINNNGTVTLSVVLQAHAEGHENKYTVTYQPA